MVTGLADKCIQKEVLRWESLDEKNVNETISFIEAKEMARDTMTQSAVTASFFLTNSWRKPYKNQLLKWFVAYVNKLND